MISIRHMTYAALSTAILLVISGMMFINNNSSSVVFTKTPSIPSTLEVESKTLVTYTITNNIDTGSVPINVHIINRADGKPSTIIKRVTASNDNCGPELARLTSCNIALEITPIAKGPVNEYLLVDYVVRGSPITSDIVFDTIAAPVTMAMYAGTENGLFRSTNGGTSWTRSDTGLTSPIVLALAIDPKTPSTLYAGTRIYQSAVFKTTNSGQNWLNINHGLRVTLVFSIAIDPITPTNVYAGIYGISQGLFRSTTGGDSWELLSNGLHSEIGVNSIAIDPITPSTIYIGSEATVYKSVDQGNTWLPASSGLPTDEIYSIAIDPINPSTLYVGTKLNGVFQSANKAASWVAVNNGLTKAAVKSLAIDHSTTPPTVYAGTYDFYNVNPSGVFRSTDSGLSWQAFNEGLTNLDINSVVIDTSVSPSIIYAGSMGGVFKYTTSTHKWTPVNTGITNMNINTLAIESPSGVSDTTD